MMFLPRQSYRKVPHTHSHFLLYLCLQSIYVIDLLPFIYLFENATGTDSLSIYCHCTQVLTSTPCCPMGTQYLSVQWVNPTTRIPQLWASPDTQVLPQSLCQNFLPFATDIPWALPISAYQYLHFPTHKLPKGHQNQSNSLLTVSQLSTLLSCYQDYVDLDQLRLLVGWLK